MPLFHWGLVQGFSADFYWRFARWWGRTCPPCICARSTSVFCRFSGAPWGSRDGVHAVHGALRQRLLRIFSFVLRVRLPCFFCCTTITTAHGGFLPYCYFCLDSRCFVRAPAGCSHGQMRIWRMDCLCFYATCAHFCVCPCEALRCLSHAFCSVPPSEG